VEEWGRIDTFSFTLLFPSAPPDHLFFLAGQHPKGAGNQGPKCWRKGRVKTGIRHPKVPNPTEIFAVNDSGGCVSDSDAVLDRANEGQVL
jgi:hypothetical protein